ncbi:Flp family type IVb pilin [Enterovibrio baiacu]|uniref:Flp family type IVb pilin n=1 Tax=Enterovibrio baiacu TaxID=2491023 RepID=UPI003D0F5ED4
MEDEQLSGYADRVAKNIVIQDERPCLSNNQNLPSVVEIITMKALAQLTHRYMKDQSGVTAIEYAIMGVGISAIILAVFITDTTFRDTLISAFQIIATNIDSVTN